MPAEPEPSETDVDAVLLEFKGDTRGAILALLHDLWTLAEDYAEAVSQGYVRGTAPASVERMRAWRQAAS